MAYRRSRGEDRFPIHDVQADQISSSGRIAATIAHEVRNPLGGMSTALDTIRKFGSDPNTRMVSLDLIERGLLSIGDVVDSVLAFHRMLQNSRLTASDLGDLQTLVGPEMVRCQLRLAWNCDIPSVVNVAATEPRQIALNLLLNACQASPPGSEVGFGAWLDDAVRCYPTLDGDPCRYGRDCARHQQRTASVASFWSCRRATDHTAMAACR
ncbi:MAG: HAMP domain-containing histidine kinase [Proteobacteria bacterium]|nr:HAMP domain-containing histidine kinase [Pseudomonadota bacterium]